MKHFYITLFFIVSFFSFSSAQDTSTSFRIKIRTTTQNETFTIPTNLNETYDYDVKWRDNFQSGGITIINAFEEGFTGNATHTYPDPGEYIISIKGDFPRIFFDNAGDSLKVLAIEQWGNVQWSSMNSALDGCTNMVINATDIPDLSQCTSLNEMFRECISLVDNGGAIDDWNVNTIQDFRGMFYAAVNFDQNLGKWDVRNALSMDDMFQNVALSAANYDATLNGWVTQNLQSNVIFDGGNSTYCNSRLSRNFLTNPTEFNWTIIDGGEACDEDKFITTWQTTTANETVTIPTTGSGYNYTVNWGDGTISSGNTGNVSHVFETPGIHQIEIYGDFPRIFFDNSGDRSKILTIEQWGTQVWTSMANAFEGCNNLVLNATDRPDLSIATDMSSMFRMTPSLEDINDILGSWNVSNITSMRNLFQFSGFNENINSWNVGNVRNMDFIFSSTSNFDLPLDNWNVSSVESMRAAFAFAQRFNQDISDWNLVGLTSLTGMESVFLNATTFNRDLGNLDLSGLPDDSILDRFFIGTSISQENYENTLVGWSTLNTANGEITIPRRISMDSSGLTYCQGAIARQTLIDSEVWSISGDTLNCTEADKFITIWETTSTNQEIKIPTTGTGYSYEIDWGDGIIDPRTGGSATHTYATAGRYEVKITGAFPRIRFNNLPGDNKLRIQEVKQWGSSAWVSMEDAFHGCANLIITATDLPDLSQVTSMREMFKNASNLVDNGGQLQNWDVSTIENFTSTFENASVFNEDLGGWNLSNAQNLSNMLNNTGLSTANYDVALTGWAANPNTPDNQNLGAANVTYCFAEAARNVLDVDKNWNINDGGSNCDFTNAFTTTWQTTTVNESITIRTTGSGYDYIIDWGDGAIESGFNGDAIHTYTNSGTYTVKIIGDFPRIILGLSNDFDNSQKIVAIEQWGTIQWTSMESAFENCRNVVLNATDIPDLTLVTNLNNMFSNAWGFLDNGGKVGDWNVSEVNTMSNLFRDTLFNGNLNNWDVRKVTSFYGMFWSADNFNQPLNNWELDSAEILTEMFAGALVFNQDLSTWNTSKVTGMQRMFESAHEFDQDISMWDVSKVEKFHFMFSRAVAFDQSLSDWDISSADNMREMFANTGLSTGNYDATLIGWATLETGETQIPTGITFSGGSSQYCVAEAARNILTTAPNNWTITDSGSSCADDFFITSWQTTAANESITVPTTGSGYDYTIDWGDGTFETGLTGNATHSYVSVGTYTIKILGDFPRIYFNNTGDKEKIRSIEQWGTINWTSMENAFYGCNRLLLNTDDIPDLSSVTNASQMFRGTSSLVDTKDKIGTWNVITITNMAGLFREATDFNENIASWNVGSVTNFSFMLSTTALFNRNLNTWNIGENVTGTINMNAMFDSTTTFNQPLNGWDVSKVTNMGGMFAVSNRFNQPLNNWDTSAVTNMAGMFLGANAFDKDLGAWNISNVNNMSVMFQQSGLSVDNYDLTLIGWATQDVGETIPSNINLGAAGIQYCFGETARNILTDATGLNWTISDDGSGCDLTAAFITTWEINSNNEEISIPVFGTGHNFDVDWGDGTISFGETEEAYHTYATAGTYTIKMIGDFGSIYFNGNADSRKIQTIEQWGSQKWTSMESAFKGCVFLEINATDVPDLSDASSLVSMFENGTCIDNGGSLGNWNVSNIVLMDNMFRNAFMEENINSWNVSAVKSINNMFQGCEDFNQPLDQWNTSNLESAIETFADTKSFNQNIGDWNITSVANFTDIFRDSNLSDENYDATLIGWTTLEAGELIPSSVTMGAGSTKYCLGETARNTLINAPYNWTITDGGVGCVATDFFITTWQTNAANETITIPTFRDGFNFSVDWGDGIVSFNQTNSITHQYATAGIYTVKITGNYPHIIFNRISSLEKERLLTVEQWGTQQWRSMSGAFNGCANLVLNATDTPDLSQVLYMDNMFKGTTSLVDNGGEINNWNTINVISMVSLFEASAFNENINDWNVSMVQTMGNMFQDNTTYNQPLNQWSPQNVSDFEHMFHGAIAFNQPIGSWNISNASAFESMFEGATAFDKDLGDWDISSTDRLGMVNMLIGSAMSQENYDATLIGWAEDTTGNTTDGIDDIPSNITFDADTTYCLGEAARNILTSAPYNWTITDGGLDASCNVLLSPKVYLQGAALNPYAGEETLMRDDLHRDNIIPTTSPYADGISLDPGIFSVLDQNALVDWVWIELRDATDNTTVIASKSALLQRDGDILDVNYQTLNFRLPPGDYYVAINHRNHLGIMSNTAIALDNSSTVIDFTNGSVVTYGNNAQTTYGMPSGISAMWSGDVNADRKINLIGSPNDTNGIRDVILNDPINQAIQFYGFNVIGYNDADVNLTGNTQIIGSNNDANLVRDNILNHPINTFIQFYGFTITEQLPEEVSTKQIELDIALLKKIKALDGKNNR